MKKTWIALIAVAVVAYPATSWYLGGQVKQQFDQQYEQLTALPYVKVVERTYDRGLFSATETVTLELFGDMTRAMQQQAEAPEAAAMKPVLMQMQSHINHGPLADGLVAARIDSEMRLPESTDAPSPFGDQAPLSAHTVVKLDGSGISDVTSPAIDAPLPALAGAAPGHMAWEGFKAQVRFSPGMADYQIEGSAPRMEIRDGKGTEMVMTGLSITGDQQRLFEDEPLLYVGQQRLALEKMTISGPAMEGKPLTLGTLVYDVDMPREGDFVDMSARMSAEVVQAGDADFGPVHYDISLKHLHARTVATLYRTMLALYSDPAFTAGDGDPQAALAPLAGPAMALLAHDPEISLDRLSFKTADGEAHLEAKAKMPGLSEEELGNPMIMMTKLVASGEAVIPEALVRTLMIQQTRANMARFDPEVELSDEHVAMLETQLGQELEGLESMGYVTRESGVLRSSFSFENGRLLVNGQPFTPPGR